MRNRAPQPTPEIVRDASKWLIEFRTEDPAQAQRDEFNAWLCTSPQHIQAYLEVAAAWSELPDEDPAGRIDVDAMIAAARMTPANVVELRTKNSQMRRHAGGMAKPLAIAAGILLCFGVAIGWFNTQHNVYSTATGEQRSLTLADGTTVELNSQSRIRLRYSDAERRIELMQGQALFHVAKNRTRPFIVATGDTQVRAVGTEFDVYRKQSATIVTVVEGKVAVSSDGVRGQDGTPSEATDKPPTLLAAGEQLAIHSKQLTRTARPDIGAATAWTQKRLVFEDTPLQDVAEEFNRYNLKPLRIEDPALQHLGISGLYSSTEPTTLIAFLAAQPTIQVTETDEEFLITRKR